MSVVTIHQPDFLPWLGFFHRIHESDIFIVLDNVQFIRRGWHHRDRIKGRNGAQWLTVPVRKKGKYSQLVREVEIDDSVDWRSDHRGMLLDAYRRAPHYVDVMELLNAVYTCCHGRLIELNMDFLERLFKYLGLSVEILWASRFDIAATGTEQLVELCRRAGAGTYLTGTGARNYLEEELFDAAGIRVWWQQFEEPERPQLHGAFEKGFSVVDALMCVGPKARQLLVPAAALGRGE